MNKRSQTLDAVDYGKHTWPPVHPDIEVVEHVPGLRSIQLEEAVHHKLVYLQLRRRKHFVQEVQAIQVVVEEQLYKVDAAAGMYYSAHKVVSAVVAEVLGELVAG